MPAPDRTNAPRTLRTPQDIHNAGFDELYQVPVSLPLVESGGALYRLKGNPDGSMSVSMARAATPAQTSVSVTNSNTEILAANADRVGATIYNEGTATAYVKLGGTATTTSYTVQMVSGSYYELPYGYTGEVDGITSSGTAELRITELT